MDLKRLYPILLIIFTNILGAGVILPVLPLYAEGTFQGTVLQVTLLASCYFGAQFLAAPVLGRLSDRHGRRPLLIISQIGTVLAFIMFIFAGEAGSWIDSLGLSLPMTGGMAMLFAARTLDGITGGNLTIAQAYVSDITSDENRAHGLGLLQGAFGAGFIFGPAFGGILSNFGPRMPFIGATIITTLTLLLTLFTLKESLTEEERAENRGSNPAKRRPPWSRILSTPPLVLMLVIGFIGSLAFSGLPATFSLYADHVWLADEQADRVQLSIGLMLTFNGIVQVITQLFLIRPLIRRFSERTVLLVGQIAIALALFGFAATSNAIIATLLFAPYAFGFGVSEPSMQSLMTYFGSRQTRGYLLGLYQSSRSLALIVGPIFAGIIYSQVSPQAVYEYGGFAMLLALLGGFFLIRMEIKPLVVEATTEPA